jgi:hypothetical protein
MFNAVTIDTQIDRLGRVAPPTNMITLKRRDAAAARAALGRTSARGAVAVAAYERAAASHEGGRMKLAAVVALGQHQAASVT